MPTSAPPFAGHFRTARIEEPSAAARVARIAAGVAGVGIAAALLTILGNRIIRGDQERVIEAGVAAEMVALDDGSYLTLDPGSRLHVHFSSQQRAITLDRGGALFDVASSDHRVFMVMVQGGSVESVGTMFRVAYENNHAAVAVYKGLVRVHSERPGPALPLPVGGSAQVSPEGLVRLIARDPRVLAARDAPFSVSLREIEVAYNARHPDRPLIVDADVQRERILLQVDETDPEQILPVLESLGRFEVDAGTNSILVKRKKRAGSRAITKTEE